MVQNDDGVSKKGCSDEEVGELRKKESISAQQAYDLYFKLVVIEDELTELMERRQSVPAIRDFVADHVNPRIQALLSDARPADMQLDAVPAEVQSGDLSADTQTNSLPAQTLYTKINSRRETTYQRIIGGLLQYIKGELTGMPPHPSYVNQSQLIEDLVSYFGEYEGISKNGLELRLAEARKSFDM
jgi:hypothetical protein